MKFGNLTPGKSVVALAVAVLHGLVLVALLPGPANSEAAARPERATPAPAAAERAPDPAATRVSPPSATSPSAMPSSAPARRERDDAASFATDPDPAVRAAFAEGAAFGEVRERTERKRRFSKVGTQFATIMSLPMPDAWTELEPLAKAGDPDAIEGMAQLARRCDEAERADAGVPIDPVEASPVATIADAPVSPAPATGRNRAELAFLAGVADHAARSMHALALACREAGISLDALFALTKGAGRVVDRDPADEARAASERLIAAFATDPSLAPLRALQPAWSDPRSPPDPARVARVLATIEGDADRIDGYAACIVEGCGDVVSPVSPDRRAAVTTWLAQRGSPIALRDAITQRVAADDVADAYAYSRYGDWLAGYACVAPHEAEQLLDARRRVGEIAQSMTPAQRAAGDARFESLVAAFGGPTRRLRHCD